MTARETALNISASPIVKEIGELCFALYTPEGDSVALSTGIIVHVHTMSDAIKYMIRQGYEENPGIEPGDIFTNNDAMIGDVHNADVQTIVPIFWEGELIGWAGGVTHEIDIGAKTPGSVPIGPISRFEDGIDLPAKKIGSDDELWRDHVLAGLKGTRTPMYWTLDEKTRLAGCHMIREAVERVILEEGIDTYKRFIREVIEDGRRSFHSRLREMTVPGRYRAPAFTELMFAKEEQLPSYARKDTLMHAPVELRITRDGVMELDYDGASCVGLPLRQLHAVLDAGRAVGAAHADADLQRQGQRRRLPRPAHELPARHVGEPLQPAGLDRQRVVLPDPVLHRVHQVALALAAGARIRGGGAGAVRAHRERLPGRRHRPVRAPVRDHQLRPLVRRRRREDGRSTGSTTRPPCGTPRATWATWRCGS